MENKKTVDVAALSVYTLRLLVNAIKILNLDAKLNGGLLLKPVIERFGKGFKKLLPADLMAQANFKRDILLAFDEIHPQIIIHGEENFDDENLDLSKCDPGQIYGIVDMVDGTDLYERGLSNWCSAVCFFEPNAEPTRRIVATFVGMPDGEVFYSTRDDKEVFVYKNTELKQNHKPVTQQELDEIYIKEPLTLLRDIEEQNLRTELKDASVCFYGQKVSSMLSSIPMHLNPDSKKKTFTLEIEKQSEKQKTFLEYMFEIDSQEKARIKEKLTAGIPLTTEDVPIDFRIYTLNGIPTVIKLIDYRIKETRKIDVVFNLTGQYPHDVVAGVYLAIKSGAIVRNLETRQDMTLEDMEEKLKQPAKSKLKYLVASNRKLADEIEPLLLPLI